TYTRCIAELRSGTFTAIERVRAAFGDKNIYLHARPELKHVISERHGLRVNEVPDGPMIILNAREALQFHLQNRWHEYDTLPAEMIERLSAGASIEAPEPIRDDAPSALWDIIHSNAVTIRSDVEGWSMANRSVERPAIPF